MRITHVRVSVLLSGPGYNNSSCALEAELEDGDDYESVAAELRAMCQSQIKGQQEVERTWERVNELRDEVVSKERERDRLAAQIKEKRGIVLQFDRLADIARGKGFQEADLLNDDPIPF